jgi:transposase
MRRRELLLLLGGAEADWTHVHHELRRPGVTLMLLWGEYRQREPDGYGYSRWCELYRAWEGRLSPTMRQAHPAGERMFVDYAGQTVELIDGRSGEIRQAQIFVAVMGASSYLRRGELDADTARLDRFASI